MTRPKPRSGSATLRIFISVVEQVNLESMEATNEAAQQEPDEEEISTSISVISESAEMPLQEVQQTPDEKEVKTGDNANAQLKNAEMSLQTAQKALGASGIRARDSADTTSTLLGNLKDLSETLKTILDIVVEKIDVVAQWSYHYRYASCYLDYFNFIHLLPSCTLMPMWLGRYAHRYIG